MRSHTCQFSPLEALQVAATALLPALVLAGGLRLGAALGCWPAPRFASDMDRTILAHQAQASRWAERAEVVLVGDSSCLMDVAVPQLAAALQRPTLNLATLSYVELGAHALLLEHYAATHPDSLRRVVLLMHPEGLRLQATSPFHREVLEASLAARDLRPGNGWEDQLRHALGLNILRDRLLGRVLSAPLPGEYGARYGFTADLWRWLDQGRGSATDPGQYRRAAAQGNAEYRLAPRLERQSQQLRAALPAGVELVVGITPAPASFVLRDHAATCARMLAQWARWLEADRALTNLPTVLPDELFASVTHLNAGGAKQFTERLAQELGRRR